MDDLQKKFIEVANMALDAHELIVSNVLKKLKSREMKESEAIKIFKIQGFSKAQIQNILQQNKK